MKSAIVFSIPTIDLCQRFVNTIMIIITTISSVFFFHSTDVSLNFLAAPLVSDLIFKCFD